MTGLAARSGRSIRSVRTAIELFVLATGWMLGGPVGVGSVFYAVSIGALTQFFLARLTVLPDTLPARNLSQPGLSQPVEECC